MTQKIDGIGQFTPETERDRAQWARFLSFVTSEPRAFSRDPHIGGHVTGSACVLSPDGNSMLLTHHAKLNRWLQLGGHCDGVRDARATAMREAQEESGLQRLRLLRDDVFDIDIHAIPARGATPNICITMSAT